MTRAARRTPRPRRWTLAATAALALCAGAGRAHGAASQEAPAALLVFPLVQVGDGVDTIIRLANAGDAPSAMRCLYVAGDGDAQSARAFTLELAAGQPVAWAASVGSADLAPATGSVPPLPAAGFTGVLRCVTTVDAGAPPPGGTLIGSATIEHATPAPDSATYAAVGFAATGASADAPEVLVLGGPNAAYGACPAEVSLQPLLDGAILDLGADGALQREAATTIAIATCSSTPIGGGAAASLTLFVTNEFDQTLSSARSLREQLVSELSRLDTTNPSTSIFTSAVTGSPSGHVRLVPNPGSGVLAVALTAFRDPNGEQAAHRANVATQLSGERELPDLIDLTLPTPAPSCTGDCDGDGAVTINELITGVNIALGSAPLAQCAAFDADGDGLVAINELIAAVGAALDGC